MPSPVDKILNQILEDKTNGATFLAGCALDGLSAWSDNGGSLNDLTQLVHRIDLLRPSIGAVGMQALLVLSRTSELTKTKSNLKNALLTAIDEAHKNLKGADDAIGRVARKEIGQGGIIVSCSYSSTAMNVILNLRPEHLYMGQGHKMEDGTRAAELLASKGITATVVPDAALAGQIEKAKAVIIGADQILTDGSAINRTSSFSMALAADYFGCPFYVVCQTIKFSGINKAKIEHSINAIEHSSKIKSYAPVFEVVPANLITRVITENGALALDRAAELGLKASKIREIYAPKNEP